MYSVAGRDQLTFIEPSVSQCFLLPVSQAFTFCLPLSPILSLLAAGLSYAYPLGGKQRVGVGSVSGGIFLNIRRCFL